MSKYKVVIHYSDETNEELDTSFENESEAIDLAQSSRLSYKLGYRTTPGGNSFEGKGNISYEIIEINN